MRRATIGLAFSAISTVALAQTAWVPTHSLAIAPVDAVDFGALDTATPLRIAVALQLPSTAALQNLVQAQNTKGSPSYGTVLTPAQFNATYAPSAASAALVQQYLQSSGFSNVAVENNRLFVTATGSAAQVETAFNTTLENFEQNGQIIYVNTTPASVPAALSGIVLSVLGLNDVSATIHPVAITPCSVSTPTCVRTFYDPQTYWKAYDATGSSTGINTSVAVMAEGDLSGVVKDLRTFEKSMKLVQVPVTIEPVGVPSTDTSGADEWDLDTQYTTGMAARVANLYIYDTTSLTDQDTALEFNRWASDDLAQVANASFSTCEAFPYIDGSMVADDQVFLEAAAQGQTLFSSTGDTGSFCSVGTPNGVPAGVPLVGYPAASPYVVGVGGTTLLTNTDGSYSGEITWYAGGGGISQFEYSPYWQTGIVPTSTSGVPLSVRALPDLSMDADPNTGAEVIVAGQIEYIGGTSLSSPLAVGSWARILSAHGNRPGFASPKLYYGYAAPTTPPANPSALTQPDDGFHDILAGANGFYTALPNYDFTTGLGSLDILKKSLAVTKAP